MVTASRSQADEATQRQQTAQDHPAKVLQLHPLAPRELIERVYWHLASAAQKRGEAGEANADVLRLNAAYEALVDAARRESQRGKRRIAPNVTSMQGYTADAKRAERTGGLLGGRLFGRPIDVVAVKPNHYDLLRVDIAASEDVIRVAYEYGRSRVHGTSVEQQETLARVEAAYDELSTPERRIAYNRSLGIHDAESAEPLLPASIAARLVVDPPAVTPGTPEDEAVESADREARVEAAVAGDSVDALPATAPDAIRANQVEDEGVTPAASSTDATSTRANGIRTRAPRTSRASHASTDEPSDEAPTVGSDEPSSKAARAAEASQASSPNAVVTSDEPNAERAPSPDPVQAALAARLTDATPPKPDANAAGESREASIDGAPEVPAEATTRADARVADAASTGPDAPKIDAAPVSADARAADAATARSDAPKTDGAPAHTDPVTVDAAQGLRAADSAQHADAARTERPSIAESASASGRPASEAAAENVSSNDATSNMEGDQVNGDVPELAQLPPLVVTSSKDDAPDEEGRRRSLRERVGKMVQRKAPPSANGHHGEAESRLLDMHVPAMSRDALIEAEQQRLLTLRTNAVPSPIQPLEAMPPPRVQPTTPAAAYLSFVTGIRGGESIPLDDDVLTLGSGPRSGLILPDEQGVIARDHARIWRHGGNFLLREADGTGTLVGRMPLAAPVIVLEDGDEIAIGQYVLRFALVAHAPQDATPAADRDATPA